MRCSRRDGPVGRRTRRSGRPTSPRSRASCRGVIQYETDRARFLGRGRIGPVAGGGHRRPSAVEHGRPVLDPIFSLRLRVRLAPGATAHAIFSTVVAESARGGARPRRQVPRLGDLRAGRDPRLDPGAGAAPSPRASSRTRRISSSAWPTGSSTRIRRCGRRPGSSPQNQRGAVRPVAARHLGRPAHRPGPDRRGRGPRDRPAAAPGPRVLAAQAARRRPGHRQRARRHVRADPTRRARDRRPDEPVDPGARDARGAAAASTSCAATSSRPRTGRCSRRPPGPSC